MEKIRKRNNFSTRINLPDYDYRHWRFMGIDVYTYYCYNGAGWFRLFGKGFSWKDMRRHNLMFSERYGYTKYYTVGNYVIKPL